MRRLRPFWPLYIVWTLVCAILFLALSGAEDPSRPKGRILSVEAGGRALSILRDRDRARFSDYEVVQVARAQRGEGSDEHRWIVLLDRVRRTNLEEAIVVELRMSDGELLRIRRPAGVSKLAETRPR